MQLEIPLALFNVAIRFGEKEKVMVAADWWLLLMALPAGLLIGYGCHFQIDLDRRKPGGNLKNLQAQPVKKWPMFNFSREILLQGKTIGTPPIGFTLSPNEDQKSKDYSHFERRISSISRWLFLLIDSEKFGVMNYRGCEGRSFGEERKCLVGG